MRQKPAPRNCERVTPALSASANVKGAVFSFEGTRGFRRTEPGSQRRPNPATQVVNTTIGAPMAAHIGMDVTMGAPMAVPPGVYVTTGGPMAKIRPPAGGG
jgi:hypothetical protein